MRNLNPCPENFDQNVVVCGMGGGGVNYKKKFHRFDIRNKIHPTNFFHEFVFPGGGGNYKK